MKFNLMALLLLVAACAGTPTDIKSGDGTHYDSSLPPKAVANCFTRNNLYADGYDPTATESVDGNIEYALKDVRYNAIVFYAAIAPKGPGSSVTVWTPPAAIWGRRIEPVIVKGC